ncbi:MAG: endonuclease/exonuclease/phosphatase family protein [Candidatus Njordarchaeia archaeon]
MKNFSENFMETLFVGIITLFFFEMLTDLIMYVYAPNLIVLELIPEYLMPILLIFLVPIVTIVIGKICTEEGAVKIMLFFTWLAIIARLLSPMFENLTYKLLLDTIGVLSIIITLPIYLAIDRDPESASINISTGFAFGIALGILFKSLGSTVDITMHWWTQSIAWILGIIAAYTSVNLYSPEKTRLGSTSDRGSGSFGKSLVSLLGVTGLFIFSYFGFGSPGVITRWVEGNYLLITALTLVVLAVFIIGLMFYPEYVSRIDSKILWAGNILFILSFGVSVSIVDNPSLHLIQVASMYLSLLLSFFVFLDFYYLLQYLLNLKPSVTKISFGLIITGFILVISILSAIFTITWDYVSPISTPFRDKTPHVLISTTLLAILPTLIVGRQLPKIKSLAYPRKEKWITFIVIALIFFGSIGGIIALSPHPAQNNTTKITVMAYNIQQGFDKNYRWNYDMVLNVIQKIKPDIIGLSESDTNRISSGNMDIVRYLADRLNMYSYFGPKTLSGTFGIALLSKYPIVEARTYYMPSTHEQTCIIEAKIRINGELYNVYVTHFGEGTNDRARQANFTRDLVDKKEKVILMGDFNADPSDFYYYYLVQYLNDSWYTVHPNGTDENGYPGYTNDWENPTSMIDHIFHSPDMVPIACYVPIWAHASDHLPIVAEFDLTK